MSTSLPSADARLTQTAAAFAQWRSSVPRPSPIPAELWAQAVELATTRGAVFLLARKVFESEASHAEYLEFCAVSAMPDASVVGAYNQTRDNETTGTIN